MDDDFQASLDFFQCPLDSLPDWFIGKDSNQFDVYLCNEKAFNLFKLAHTQWRSNGFSVIGLDYGVIFSILDRQGVDPDEQLDLLDQVQLIEIGFINQKQSEQ